jgi:uncharacterized phage protein gp47/JayE
MGPFNNYQLYARCLRLWFMDDHPGADWHNHCAMEGIVRDVIYPDRNLIWC